MGLITDGKVCVVTLANSNKQVNDKSSYLGALA